MVVGIGLSPMNLQKTASWFTPLQIRLGLCMIGLLGYALYVGKKIGESEGKNTIGFLCLLGVLILLIRLGKRAWLVFAFVMNLDIPVPVTFGKDFSMKELLCMLLMAQAVFQMGVRRQMFYIFRPEYAFFLLYSGWALLVLIMNPVGFAIFGSQIVGGRFYFQLFLATMAFLVLARGDIREGDAKLFIGLTLTSSIINTIYTYFAWGVPAGALNANPFEEGQYYTWQQALADPGSLILRFLFAHYWMSHFVSLSGWLWLPLIGACYSVLLLSGRRMGLASVMAYPFFAAFMRRQWFVAVWMCLIMLGGAFGLAWGQGKLFDLPLTVQRALSYLPGEWHPTADLGLDDPYRRILREEALHRIQKHPWIGVGCNVSVADYWADRFLSGQQITGNLAGGSWHTTWLGIAADFGIPAAVFWGLLLVQVTLLSLRLARKLPEKSFQKTMAGFIFITLCSTWVNSWTSGHSTILPFNYWWLYALLFPLARNLRESTKPLET